MKYLINILVLISFKLLSQNEGIYYSENFFKYDFVKKAYLPYINNPAQTNCISFEVRDSEITKDIFVSNTKEYAIFINSKLYLCALAGDTSRIPALDLLNSQSDQQLITIYTTQSLKDLQIYNIKSAIVPIEENFGDIIYTKKNAENRYISGFIIVIISLILIKKSIPTITTDIFRIVNSSFNDRGSVLKSQSVAVIVIVVVLFFLMIFVFTPSLDGKMLLFNAQNTYILSTFVIYLLLLFTLKAIMHLIFGNLYKIPKGSNSFTFEILFVSIFIIFVFVPLYLFVFTPYYTILALESSFLGYSTLLLFVGLTINEVYFFYSRQQGRKIYLISYICICDLIPFIVSYKFVKDFHIA